MLGNKCSTIQIESDKAKPFIDSWEYKFHLKTTIFKIELTNQAQNNIYFTTIQQHKTYLNR